MPASSVHVLAAAAGDGDFAYDETEVVDHHRNVAMRLVRRIVPTRSRYDGHRLFTKKNGKRLATPLFAVDSCPPSWP